VRTLAACITNIGKQTPGGEGARDWLRDAVRGIGDCYVGIAHFSGLQLLAFRARNTQPPSAAGEHFADAERILAALPLVKRGGERDRHVQVALVHVTLAIAAILAHEDGHGGR
jgi:hypothetical protein